jgi:4-nitrophenyl phosphatase
MNNIKAFAFDLDGTLYYGNNAVSGAVETISSIIKAGYKVFYFTNNSAKTRLQIVTKLSSLGFSASLINTYTASYACSRYLLKNHIDSVYVVGSDDLINDFRSQGINVVEPEKASSVVVCLDMLLTYDKISGALLAIENGAKLIVANRDSSFPIENNKRLPGCGAMVGAIVSATGHEPDFIAGKPNTYMLELLCNEWNLSASEICVVGDSIESDIEMANHYQCSSVLFDPLNKYSNYTAQRITCFPDLINILQ